MGAYALKEEAMGLIGSMTESKLRSAVLFLRFIEQQDEKSADSEPLSFPFAQDTSRRIGVAKGKLVYPANFDEANDEVAELFGI